MTLLPRPEEAMDRRQKKGLDARGLVTLGPPDEHKRKTKRAPKADWRPEGPILNWSSERGSQDPCIRRPISWLAYQCEPFLDHSIDHI